MMNKHSQQYIKVAKYYRKRMPRSVIDSLFSNTLDPKNPILQQLWIKKISIILKKNGRIKMTLSTGEIMEIKISYKD